MKLLKIFVFFVILLNAGFSSQVQAETDPITNAKGRIDLPALLTEILSGYGR